MNMQDLYEFCMDWQMDQVSKDQLWIEFIAKDWHWEAFQKAAKEKGWYVPSMSLLKDLD